MPRRYSPADLATLRSNPGAVLGAPKKRKHSNEEFRIQSAFVKLWRSNCASLGIAQCLGFHVPNGSVMGGGNEEWQKKERAIRGRLQKIAGVEPGVLDWLLLVPSKNWHAILIEFKAPGKQLSDEQQAFSGFALSRGYFCDVHCDANEAWRSLLNYLNL